MPYAQSSRRDRTPAKYSIEMGGGGGGPVRSNQEGLLAKPVCLYLLSSLENQKNKGNSLLYPLQQYGCCKQYTEEKKYRQTSDDMLI